MAEAESLSNEMQIKVGSESFGIKIIWSQALPLVLEAIVDGDIGHECMRALRSIERIASVWR